MILPGELLTNRTLHQPRKRRENVNGWVNLPVVELTIHKDLSLSDVTSQIGNRMCNIYTNGQSELYLSFGMTLLPSLGIVRIGIWVMEPFRPSTRPARS